ncbi:26S proteasome non-ATPase regulatory subunit 8 homolog A-like isoform X2 [Salvia splendens]|nr:26S proteasome non-ATPase regulatory subunit 8 homolog A-like isoform X2 [Salvia splendens]
MDPKFTEVSQLFERFKAPILRKDFDTSTKFLSQLKLCTGMDRENKKRKEIENVLVVVEDLVRRQRQQSFLLLSLAEYFSLRRSSDDEDDTTMVTDLLWKIPEQIRRMDRLIRLTDTDCVNNLRMDRNCFGRLCLLLRERMGLKDRKFIALTGFKSLPPLFEKTPNAVHEMTLARDIYEHAVVLSVKIEDQDAFERDFCQLKPYYTDTAVHLPPSPQEYPILGLNLLRLLVQNRIAEFHTELELLSASALENPCFKHAVELEQSFMEGAYNRVLTARQTVPHETYVYFMDLLAKTVRDEIAGCIEKAYDSLSLNDARQMLLYSSDKEVVEYVKEEHPEWEIKNGFVFFQRAKESVPCKEIPSLQLINQTLSYARELERIV